LPLEKSGLISISIRELENGIHIKIEDNGIGVETSVNQKFGTSSHVSNGMKITRQRMEVLRNMTKLKYEVVGPVEIKDKEENTIGTSVEIFLPRLFRSFNRKNLIQI